MNYANALLAIKLCSSIQPLHLFPRHAPDCSRAVRGAVDGVVMQQHRHSVPRQLEVQLDAIDACIDRLEKSGRRHIA